MLGTLANGTVSFSLLCEFWNLVSSYPKYENEFLTPCQWYSGLEVKGPGWGREGKLVCEEGFTDCHPLVAVTIT